MLLSLSSLEGDFCMRINGVEVSDAELDQFEGPNGDVADHFRRFHQRQQSSFYERGTGVSADAVTQPRNVQSSVHRHGGDPRMFRKHCRPTVSRT
jgi:hypothetical protein